MKALLIAALALAMPAPALASDVNIVVNAPYVVVLPTPPLPRESGPACWHQYSVPSDDDPTIVKTVRIFQCEKMGTDTQ